MAKLAGQPRPAIQLYKLNNEKGQGIGERVQYFKVDQF